MHSHLSTAPAVPRLAYDVIEAAEALGVSPNMIRRLTASGELRASRIGTRVVYAVSELQRFLEAAQAEESQSVRLTEAAAAD